MFEVSYENKDELVIYPKGELDLYTTEDFKKDTINKYNEDKKNILIDGKELEYIDSTGLGALMYILNEIEKNNHKIALVNIKKNIIKLFNITKLDSIFEMRD